MKNKHGEKYMKYNLEMNKMDYQKEKEIFIKVMKTMDKNLDDILKGGN